MDRFELGDKADLRIYYQADSSPYRPGWFAELGVTEEFFIATYTDCPSLSFKCNGIEFGGVIVKGEEWHIAVLPDYHGRWSTLMEPMFNWVFSIQDPVYAPIHRFNKKAVRFMRKMQWDCVGGDAVFITYKLSADQLPKALAAYRAGRQK